MAAIRKTHFDQNLPGMFKSIYHLGRYNASNLPTATIHNDLLLDIFMIKQHWRGSIHGCRCRNPTYM